jgi:hypothetical protein
MGPCFDDNVQRISNRKSLDGNHYYDPLFFVVGGQNGDDNQEIDQRKRYKA